MVLIKEKVLLFLLVITTGYEGKLTDKFSSFKINSTVDEKIVSICYFSHILSCNVIIFQLQHQIVKLCFTERLKTVIVSTDLIDIFFQTDAYNMEPLPVFVIDVNIQGNNYHEYFPTPMALLLAANSEKSLKTTLEEIKFSILWNINRLFIVISTQKQDCNKNTAYEILHVTWMMNLLSSFYLCYQADDVIMLYTYNPFGKHAAQPWIEVMNDRKADKRWTLYSKPILKGKIFNYTCCYINGVMLLIKINNF